VNYDLTLRGRPRLPQKTQTVAASLILPCSCIKFPRSSGCGAAVVSSRSTTPSRPTTPESGVFLSRRVAELREK